MLKTINTLLSLSLLLTSAVAFSASAPYNHNDNYKNALKKSKLQHPGSNTVWEKTGFNNKHNSSYFFIPSKGDKWMTLRMSGKKGQRTELRNLTDFNKSSKHVMKGTLKLKTKPKGEVTVLQVHNRHIGAPALRVARVKDKFVAIFREDDCSKGCNVNYKRVNLAGISGSHTFRVEVNNGKIKVKMGSNSAEFDLKNWRSDGFYFKAGAYLQSDGTAETQFKSLNW